MKIKVQNLGRIKKAEIDLSKDLILFTGYNNTGKTYLNYLLYGFFQISYSKIVEGLKNFFKIEDYSNDKVIKYNIKYDFVSKKDEFLSLLIKLVENEFSKLFIEKSITPKLDLYFSDKDIKELKSLDFNSQSGKSIVFQNGVLIIEFENYNEEYRKQKANVLEGIISQSFKDVVLNFKQNIFQIRYSPSDKENKIYFFPAERAALSQYAYDIIYTRAEKYEENLNANSNNFLPISILFNKKPQKRIIPKNSNGFFHKPLGSKKSYYIRKDSEILLNEI